MAISQRTFRYSLLIASALFAIFVYFYGLGSDHLATNGDELVYAQMTRATAKSGHLLPLQAPIARLSNTKPPLLFWQGIASTHWGKNWSLWNLRYPNVLYTLMIAMMVFLLGKKIGERTETGFLATMIYLSFFGTFRYGRCFLTSAPEVFWLFLPFFILLYWPKLFRSWSIVPLLGIIIGIGLLYKSFALLAPVAVGLSWWYYHERNNEWRPWLAYDVGKIILLSVISLGIFSLWFFLDPHPQAIIHDFIWRENVGKFDAGAGSYLLNFFWGGSSVWRNVISYPLNAGLLAPAVVALIALAFLHYKNLTRTERLLWIWVVTVFVIFSFPNQRDERYLLLGMPALALLLAFRWEMIPRWVLSITLVAVGIITLGLGGLAYLLQQHLAATAWGIYHYPIIYWLLLIATIDLVGLGLMKPHLTQSLLCPSILFLYLCYAAFLLPFDGSLGNFDQTAHEAIHGKTVLVPTNFNAREESYRFLLPETKALIPYDYKASITIDAMKGKAPCFIVSLPLTDQSDKNLQGVQLLGRRLNLIDRFNAAETGAIMMGNVAPYLFHQDLLMERTPQ